MNSLKGLFSSIVLDQVLKKVLSLRKILIELEEQEFHVQCRILKWVFHRQREL